MQVDAAYLGPGAPQTAGIRGRGGLELNRENDWPVIFLLLVLKFPVPTQAGHVPSFSDMPRQRQTLCCETWNIPTTGQSWEYSSFMVKFHGLGGRNLQPLLHISDVSSILLHSGSSCHVLFHTQLVPSAASSSVRLRSGSLEPAGTRCSPRRNWNPLGPAGARGGTRTV